MCRCSKCGFLLQKAIRRPLFSPSEALWSSLCRALIHTTLPDIPDRTCELCAAAHSLHRQYLSFTHWPSCFLSFVHNRVPLGLFEHRISESLTVYLCGIVKSCPLKLPGLRWGLFYRVLPNSARSPQDLPKISSAFLFLAMFTLQRQPDGFRLSHLAAEFMTFAYLLRFTTQIQLSHHRKQSYLIRSERRNPARFFVLPGRRGAFPSQSSRLFTWQDRKAFWTVSSVGQDCDATQEVIPVYRQCQS